MFKTPQERTKIRYRRGTKLLSKQLKRAMFLVKPGDITPDGRSIYNQAWQKIEGQFGLISGLPTSKQDLVAKFQIIGIKRQTMFDQRLSALCWASYPYGDCHKHLGQVVKTKRYYYFVIPKSILGHPLAICRELCGTQAISSLFESNWLMSRTTPFRLGMALDTTMAIWIIVMLLTVALGK